MGVFISSSPRDFACITKSMETLFTEKRHDHPKPPKVTLNHPWIFETMYFGVVRVFFTEINVMVILGWTHETHCFENSWWFSVAFGGFGWSGFSSVNGCDICKLQVVNYLLPQTHKYHKINGNLVYWKKTRPPKTTKSHTKPPLDFRNNVFRCGSGFFYRNQCHGYSWLNTWNTLLRKFLVV